MSEYKIIMPSKPRVVLEEGNKGVFEIDGLFPGYGHTRGFEGIIILYSDIIIIYIFYF
jgi:hypothetical protein